MATVISFANQKGGVGKTTSVFNVGASLASRGYRVLMIDLDPQASLTIYTGLEPYDYENSIVDVLKNPKQDISKCVVSIREKLSIIPSRIELASAESELLGRPARELTLARAISGIKDDYDYILIDCPPQLSTLTINALACTDKVIIPCKTDYLAYRGLEALDETLATVKTYFKPDIESLGVLATMYDARVADDKDLLNFYKEKYKVIGVIKRTAQAKKGLYDGLSSVEFMPHSEIAKEYERVVDLIISK